MVSAAEDQECAYAVVTWNGFAEETERSGLSHAEAMMRAEELQREGRVVRIMHEVRGRYYEVDSYPPR